MIPMTYYIAPSSRAGGKKIFGGPTAARGEFYQPRRDGFSNK
jgi:hypothetical protein